MALNATGTAVLRLVAAYVGRQRLAADVLAAYRPYLLGLPWPDGRPPKSWFRETAKGPWGAAGEWRYRIHGGGCRLDHTTRGERIEWDAPDLDRFDPHWFIGWVRSVRGAEGISPALRSDDPGLEAAVLSVLAELQRSAHLLHFPGRTNSYKLVRLAGQSGG